MDSTKMVWITLSIMYCHIVKQIQTMDQTQVINLRGLLRSEDYILKDIGYHVQVLLISYSQRILDYLVL